jgi:hypothetical protein
LNKTLRKECKMLVWQMVRPFLQDVAASIHGNGTAGVTGIHTRLSRGAGTRIDNGWVKGVNHHQQQSTTQSQNQQVVEVIDKEGNGKLAQNGGELPTDELAENIAPWANH